MRTDDINYTEQVVVAAERFFDSCNDTIINNIEKAKDELFLAIQQYRDHHNPDPDNYLDHDGYPTELALKKIEQWHYSRGWTSLMEFIRSLWLYSDFGYWTTEKDAVTVEYGAHKTIADIHYISTAGWSGNEDIIRALQKNWMFWNFCWHQSRTGGHYIFHIRNDELSTNNTLPNAWSKDVEDLKDEHLDVDVPKLLDNLKRGDT